MRFSTTILSTVLVSVPASVHAWGAVGHEIVATIAQMYLHPSVLPTLCEILELPAGKCHLAPVSTWADQNRIRMRWSAALHYVGALDDHPSQTCAFPGEHNWAGKEGVNVLDGIKNTTQLLRAWVDRDVNDAVANEALKFLIHFVGDLHQPLHLTGRDRGGNSVKVLFDRRHTNLHSLWDGLLIAKAIRTVPRNYSRPLPSRKIESALRGTIYDSYIRRILWEGVLNPWKEDVPSWLACPSPELSPAPTSSSASSFDFSSISTSPSASFLSLYQSILRFVTPTKQGVEIIPDGPIVCPYFWAKPNHALNCDIIWPKALDEPPFNVRASWLAGSEREHNHEDEDIRAYLEGSSNEFVDSEVAPDSSNTEPPLLQLDTPEYAGEIARRMILEKLLAQGGIRLAGILNYIFAPSEGEPRAFLA